MQFTRLKLSGFKSFVDPTELVIETGLTGIVGPNGCGKSNLVEALRWVMGETSAKKMRGGEMDDVIFAGTAHRPARNVAEVALGLDNSSRSAPAAFNEHTELEVSRRIERASGSNYRVNGREVRARDVQLLFADAASGARSTALVSQGQIGALIGAKPTERRHLLEEAAGITGLHSRRHEAELRLRAAETNLDRLEDVIATLETQMQALKRQARQAARYRSLSGRIRKAEAALHYRRWSEAEQAYNEARGALDVAERHAGEAARVAAQASAAQTGAAAHLPELRKTEAEAAAALHRLEVARDTLEAEENRLTEAQAAAQAQQIEIGSDIGRETERRAEAQQTLARLTAEAERLTEERAAQGAELAAAASALDEARQATDAAERVLAEHTEKAAADEARRISLQRQKTELEHRLETLGDRLRDVAEEKDAATAQIEESSALTAAETAAATAAEQAQQAKSALEAVAAGTLSAETARGEASEAERAERESLREAEVAHERVAAEARALAAVLSKDQNETSGPIIDEIGVPSEYGLAVAAALGDDLLVGTDVTSPSHWRELTALDDAPALPTGAQALSDLVSAPSALGRRLRQVGLVDQSEGPRLQGELAQGQRLVSREGDLWRWDGFAAAADAVAGAAARLRQRQRLEELNAETDTLDDDLAAARTKVADAESRREQAEQTYKSAREAESIAGTNAREADDSLAQAREARTAAIEAVSEDRSRVAALDDATERLTHDQSECRRAMAETDDAIRQLPAPEEARAPLDNLKQDLAARRHDLDERFRTHDGLVRTNEARTARLESLDHEITSWRRRVDDADEQIAALNTRREAVAGKLEELRDLPSSMRERKAALDQQLATSGDTRREAASALADAEARLAEADRLLKSANDGLAAAREDKVRAEGRRDQAMSLRDVEAERIRESFDCAPQETLPIAEISDASNLDDIDRLERQVERLHRERENMGTVNLRAEIEATELAEQIDTMGAEREDLLSAIAKLRGGIASLNREGRQRLLAAFDEVNKHFQTLFERLFGGGRAHLDLTGSDDPLEAGLEVMASPPGKRLQNLSLLSGGEKALAALALLFAVFLTKPAPICVLDEVDAPLDDHNVDRFCALLDEIAASSQTRFLIITHHRLTMARMDRLYGVTMGERGVSQLVSVDIAGAGHLQAAE